MVSSVSTINTQLQLTADAHVRGRVMSMLALALFGLSPLGSLHVGTWAHWIGTPAALAAGGLVCLLIAFWLLASARELHLPIEVAHGRDHSDTTRPDRR
jgi:predicted MFS family arabinose efflux permease